MCSDKYKESIEQLILSAKKNEITQVKFLSELLSIKFYVVCDEKALNVKQYFLPLCVEIDGENNVCVFTRKEWANEYLTRDAIIVEIDGKKILHLIPERYGLIFNPNHDESVRISSLGMKNVLRDFG